MKWQIRLDEKLLTRIVLAGLVIISLCHFATFVADEIWHSVQHFN